MVATRVLSRKILIYDPIAGIALDVSIYVLITVTARYFHPEFESQLWK
jgi:hypothetical protein